MLTAAQVAAMLGISARKVYEIDPALLPRHEFGRAVRYAPSDVEAYREACRSTESRARTAALAGSLSSRVVSKASESEYEKAFRRLGLVPRRMRSTALNAPVSTPKQPEPASHSSSSSKLSLVTSLRESQT